MTTDDELVAFRRMGAVVGATGLHGSLLMCVNNVVLSVDMGVVLSAIRVVLSVIPHHIVAVVEIACKLRPRRLGRRSCLRCVDRHLGRHLSRQPRRHLCHQPPRHQLHRHLGRRLRRHRPHRRRRRRRCLVRCLASASDCSRAAADLGGRRRRLLIALFGALLSGLPWHPCCRLLWLPYCTLPRIACRGLLHRRVLRGGHW